ncbi:MAG: Na+/H+ antiporter subunit C [Spirochaetae bacterium HGW-Spirochaetae-3]|jgi:multicomponent Na+:H+ antiporter subunit C|nr:MAG: Na+/H+ antiporter subunit C [Spirochaetae bacterium HGW-Spirochaetae-3]
MIARSLILCLFITGLVGLTTRRNLVKKAYALSIMNSAVVLLFVLEGSGIGDKAPLLGGSPGVFVDPVPQALMLTAIVVGVCVSALALTIAYRLHRIYGTLDADELKRLVGHE